jgi:hypothetical protein
MLQSHSSSVSTVIVNHRCVMLLDCIVKEVLRDGILRKGLALNGAALSLKSRIFDSSLFANRVLQKQDQQLFHAPCSRSNR